jgi:ribosomal protein S24E
MKVELQKEKELPLMSRKRATFTVECEGATPARKDLVKEIAKKINVSEKLIVVKHIYSKFGFTGAKVIVHIYKNEADMNKFEHKGLLEKQTGKKKKGAAGEAAE